MGREKEIERENEKDTKFSRINRMTEKLLNYDITETFMKTVRYRH